jgi:disulfide oxidoreductase YuzD
MKLWGNTVEPGYDETSAACPSCQHTPTKHATATWMHRLFGKKVWAECCTAQNYMDTFSGLPETCLCKHSFHVLNYV